MIRDHVHTQAGFICGAAGQDEIIRPGELLKYFGGHISVRLNFVVEWVDGCVTSKGWQNFTDPFENDCGDPARTKAKDDSLYTDVLYKN